MAKHKNEAIQIADIATVAPKSVDKKETKAATEVLVARIAELQNLMYGERKRSLLLVLQGMDSSGKDGLTRKLFSQCSPTGIDTYAFKRPTEEEFAHDFLWRVHRQAPRKGMIQIFNRSHYEDVLIQRVHKSIDEERVTQRIGAINAFEDLLQFDNQTVILKCYMHISKDRQLEKLQERLDNPDKNWKHNAGDWDERKHWDNYMRCYQDVFDRSTTPWHAIPCDQEWYRDYVAAKLVVRTLEALDMKLPVLTAEQKIVSR